MVDSVIFYGNIIPLDRDNHRDFVLDIDDDRFGFSAGSHIVPAVSDEFVAAAPHIPIVFLPGVNAPVPVFLVGLRTGKNVLVSAEGRWLGNYIPAYVRRNPLMFVQIEGRAPITCIDSAYTLPKGKPGAHIFTHPSYKAPLLAQST